MIDRGGRIVSRAFEDAYQERDSAASILASLPQSSTNLEGATDVVGKYLRARLSASDRLAAPGHRVTLVADVTPGRNIHVYAPGQQAYIAVELTPIEREEPERLWAIPQSGGRVPR